MWLFSTALRSFDFFLEFPLPFRCPRHHFSDFNLLLVSVWQEVYSGRVQFKVHYAEKASLVQEKGKGKGACSVQYEVQGLAVQWKV